MTNKELKRRRMMDYFISATVEIIDSEGVGAVSARRVADLAGYSYATIYNYFQDINHLLWHCVPEYFARLSSLVQPDVLPGPSGAKKLRQACRAYANFFVTHPFSFQFMFMADLGKAPQEISDALAEPLFLGALNSILEQCVAEGVIREEDMQSLGVLIGFTVNGALLFHVSKRMESSPEEFLNQLDLALDPILKGRDRL